LQERVLEGLLGDVANAVVSGLGTIAGIAVAGASSIAGAAVGGGAGQAIAQGGQDLGTAVIDGSQDLGKAAGAVVDGIVEATPEIWAVIKNGKNCWASIVRDEGIGGGLLGPAGAIIGAGVGALTSIQSCGDAMKYAFDAGKQILDTTKAELSAFSCPSDSIAITNSDVSFFRCSAFNDTHLHAD
jgi:hypothetical protein